MEGFQTERLTVENWTPHLGDKGRRSALEAHLQEILTPSVLAPLPAALQLTDGRDVGRWIQDRAAEADLFLIRDKTETTLGLLILADLGGAPREIHVGYLFGETAWGQGFATEMVLGLCKAVQAPARLHAGVADGHLASIRVLEKAGFQTSAGDGLFVRDLY